MFLIYIEKIYVFDWKIFLLLAYIGVELSWIVKKKTGLTTFTFNSSPKSSSASLICCGVVVVILPFPMNSMFIPGYLCLILVFLTRFQNLISIMLTIVVSALSPILEVVLLSTYYPKVHWLSFMYLFEVHLSYGFSAKPRSKITVENSSYHWKSLSIITYMDSKTLTYRPFFLTYILTFSLCLGFTLHMMSKHIPQIS